jgi:hypothetical protein
MHAPPWLLYSFNHKLLVEDLSIFYTGVRKGFVFDAHHAAEVSGICLLAAVSWQ